MKPAPGSGSLRIEHVAGQSAVTSAVCADPFRLLLPVPRGPSAWVCTSSFGGGLVAGDQTSLDLELTTGARCYLGSQASTKVYRGRAHAACGHHTYARLGAGAVLVFAPDPVQPFAGALYEQRQTFWLAPSASLVLVDWVTAGRAARGERWAFSRYRSRNELWIGDTCRLIDALRLDPADGAIGGAGRMGRFNVLATVVITGPAVASAAGEVMRAIEATPVGRRAGLVQSASPFADGVLVRLAGTSVEEVTRTLRGHLAFLRDVLHDDPWQRKW